PEAEGVRRLIRLAVGAKALGRLQLKMPTPCRRPRYGAPSSGKRLQCSSFFSHLSTKKWTDATLPRSELPGRLHSHGLNTGGAKPGPAPSGAGLPKIRLGSTIAAAMWALHEAFGPGGNSMDGPALPPHRDFVAGCLRQAKVAPRTLTTSRPDFLIISPPKTGTTWLADNL